MSRDIVFVYDHFYPDYSAGGPVTSLANLAALIGSSCNVRILSSAWYYSPRKKFDGVPLNQWTTQGDFTAWYADSPASIANAISTLAGGSVCYLNGVFSKDFFLPVLRQAKNKKLDVVITPRGMLQHGALQDKALKKNIYLFALRFTNVLKGVRWHATDEEERTDIRRHFGRALDVDVIPNVPRLPVPINTGIRKDTGTLRLVYFSLISRKKNLGFLLELLANASLPGVTLDIVGPVKDADYWSECQPSVERSNGTIRYLGDRNPAEINELLSDYHFFVLPTNGENFGHAIMEAMSTWRPVMISEHTPWKDLQPFHGGYSLPLVTSQWEDKLKQVQSWSQDDFDKACVGAMDYFRTKINMSGLRSMYLSLFKAHS
jgi:glycosyltransferase involved in cell wall biosynthesis